MKTDEKKKLYFCKNKIAWCQIDNVRDNMFEMVEHMKKDDGALDMDITSILDKIKKEQNNSLRQWISERRKFIGEIVILLTLIFTCYILVRGILQANMSVFAIYTLPVVLTAMYYVISKDIRFIRFFEISKKEISIRRCLFIVALIDALAIQAALYVIFPWYIKNVSSTTIYELVWIYNLVTFAINAVCLLYSVYRYKRYCEISLGGIWGVEFGVFATWFFSAYVQRSASVLEGSYVFVLMPYLISVVLYICIEMYKNRQNKMIIKA